MGHAHTHKTDSLNVTSVARTLKGVAAAIEI